MRPIRIFALIFVALCLLATPAGAQEKEFVWQRFDADLNVARDGTMQVTETQRIQFLSGTWQNGGRKIPIDRVDNITDVQVSEVVPDGPQRLPTQTEIEGNQLNITWRFSPARPGEVREFQLRYTVQGIVRVYPNNQQVRWIAVPDERRFPVESSSVTLRLPGNVAPDQLKLESYPERLGGEERPQQNGATFEIDGLPAFEGFEVRAQFPAGVVATSAPTWQQEADEQNRLNEEVKPRNNVVLLGLGFLVPLLGLVSLLGLWFTRGKDPGVGRDAETINTPPSDLPAPLVGVLLDERADVQDVISAIMSLAERGVIRITQQENENLMGSPSDYRLELIQPYNPQDLHGYERTLIDNLFAQGDAVMLSEVKGRFMAAVPVFRDHLYEEVVRAGLFKGNPEKVRNRYRGFGIGLMVFGVLFGCLGITALSAYANPFFIALPALGLLAVGIGLTQLSRAMPVRTLNGAVEASRWRSFRNYLAHIERTPDIAQDKGAFERYMSYATAFGLGRSWLDKFASVGTPAPAWYQQGVGMGADFDIVAEPFGGRRRGGGGFFGGPVIIVPPFGGYGGGGSHGSGGGGVPTAGDTGGGDVFGDSGLFDFGGDGRGALDSASGGFGDLLDMASDAFGGGGWGGGGSGGFGGGSGGGGADFS